MTHFQEKENSLTAKSLGWDPSSVLLNDYAEWERVYMNQAVNLN